MYKNLALLLSLTLLIVGCGGDTGGTSVWIDIPHNPTTLVEASQINIVGHTSSPEGVSKVEIWVNDTVITSLTNISSSGDLAKFEANFLPAGPGEYQIQVIATGVNGEVSAPDSALVIVGEQTVNLPVEEPPTPITPTDTPTPVPQEDNSPVVNYWADPATIAAGACTTIYWDVQNVSNVEFGGRNQSLQGSYQDCMCESQTYPMKITYQDGSQETFRVTIDITGSCTPTLPPDTSGPAEPTILKPVNGQEFACLSYLMLRWSEVSDPSGIDEYQIQLERHPGDNNWQPWQGGSITGIGGLEYELYVECGWIYRFRVRGVDGNGNIGDWSDWSYFTVNIG